VIYALIQYYIKLPLCIIHIQHQVGKKLSRPLDGQAEQLHVLMLEMHKVVTEIVRWGALVAWKKNAQHQRHY